MKIFIYDEFGPEDMAMMQALYSRSAASVEEHAKKVQASGSGKFMERYYVGYGHASIADCGSTTIFLEGVSMLVAKAVQDWPLYSGQETSSRYIDMSKQALADPVGTKASRAILDEWIRFYVESQSAVEAHIRAKYPQKAGEDAAVYDRAVKARVFDTLRGWLPAGVTTQLSWHTNLRQAHDKLALLKYHPLAEVREVAEQILAALRARYAHSFGHKAYTEQEAYRKFLGEKFGYYSVSKRDTRQFATSTTIKKNSLEPYKKLLQTRPEKTNLPHFLTELGGVTFDFLLDFGSFRDIQRHRHGVCRMPLLTTTLGFNNWYLEQLPANTQKQARVLLKKQERAIRALDVPAIEKQYYTAMGYNVACRATYGLPAAVYTLELRSGRLVHPTLRAVARQMYKAVKKLFPLVTLHADLDPDDWDVRRGLQDIREKK